MYGRPYGYTGMYVGNFVGQGRPPVAFAGPGVTMTRPTAPITGDGRLGTGSGSGSGSRLPSINRLQFKNTLRTQIANAKINTPTTSDEAEAEPEFDALGKPWYKRPVVLGAGGLLLAAAVAAAVMR